MVSFLEIIVLVLFVVLGCFIARSIKVNSIFIDFLFVLLLAIFTWIGRDTYLIKVFNFKLLLPTVIQALIFGILLKHFILKKNIKFKT